jgi:hypothetical protein
MSDANYIGGNPTPPAWQQADGGSMGVSDVVIQLQGIVSQLTALVKVFKGRPIYGTFTLSAAPSTAIIQPAVQSNSEISWTPTNAAAATLQGSAKALYISVILAGTSFTVTTGSGGNAAGTETFSYVVNTPI